MKKLFLALAIISGVSILNAQSFKPTKEKKTTKDDYSIEVKESEKQKIDWPSIKDYFSDTMENDSIQFSVKLNTLKTQKLKSEKKYTVRGTKKNIDKLIQTLQNMIKD